MVETVPHIAVVLHVTDDEHLARQAAIWTEACRRQLLEHVGPSWGIVPPGVFFYGVDQHIPADQAAVVGIYADAGMAEAAGYHTAIGRMVLGAVDLSRSGKPSRTLSHEVAEIAGNAWLDGWERSPLPGRLYARELCDPCQRHDYVVNAEVLGGSYPVTVADFVLPAWFGGKNPDGSSHRTWCSTVDEAFEIAPGGYQIALEGDEILYLPSKNEAVRAAAVTRPFSRTKQISKRVVIPHAPGAPVAPP